VALPAPGNVFFSCIMSFAVSQSGKRVGVPRIQWQRDARYRSIGAEVGRKVSYCVCMSVLYF